MPGDSVTLRVRAQRGSCVCVATVDKSLYLLKPDFQLSPEKVGHIYRLCRYYTLINNRLKRSVT